MSSISAVGAVARIAALASATLVNVAPAAKAATSSFSSVADKAAELNAQLELEQLNQHVELGSVLVQLKPAGNGLISVLSHAHQQTLTRLVPHLPKLVNTPLVFHVASAGEHSDLMALRQSGLVLLHSSTAAQAHDHALLATKIATSAKRAVLHFFEDVSGPVDEVTNVDLASFVGSAAASSSTDAAAAVPKTNGVNGHANGVNGVNGHSNGHLSAAASEAGFDDLESAIDAAYEDVAELVGHAVEPFQLVGASDASNLAVVLGAGSEVLQDYTAPHNDLAVLDIRLVRPSLPQRLLDTIPAGIERIAVLEQSVRRTTRLGPLFVDVATAFQGSERALPAVLVSGVLGHIDDGDKAAKELIKALEAPKPKHAFVVGDIKKLAARAQAAPAAAAATSTGPVQVPKHEEAYNLMLEQVFAERLSLVNSANEESDDHPAARSPEYAFGQVLAQLEQRDELVRAVNDALRDGGISTELHEALSQWLAAKQDAKKNVASSNKVASLLQSSTSGAALQKIKSLSSHLSLKSRWIVGSDAWAYDAGMGGVHHVIASGRNVNMLIFDSVPYTKRDAQAAHKRKKDIALYAMNYGNVYVASTAIYADYTQVLHALMEADKFDGPSVVLAYVPYRTVDAPALDVLRETKLAIDSGYWPLFRWDPSAEARGSEVFRLDGVRLREQLQQFLDRQNLFTTLVKSRPELSYDIAASQGNALHDLQRRKAKEAYEKMLGSLDGPPLLILVASDGGNADKVAKKLAVRAKARGVAARLLTMDDYPVTEELKDEKNVVFLTSTAGQGEAPQNGRFTYKALHAMANSALPDTLNFTVFAMGDSHYWPRPEDAHYYNKPGKDIDVRLEQLGAVRMAPIGLGDDQDADGYQTGYKIWEPLLWKALGVDTVEVKEAEPEPITNEHMKIASNYLRGTIKEGLEDTSTGALAESDGQLTKFHGTYQQYDRDTLEERKAAGLEPAYSFMIRARIPGGVVTPAQWLQLDDVAEKYGNQTIKITTRQTIQYHCIIKSNLKAAMQGINKSMLDTIAACGDVNRNVMCSPNPNLTELHEDVFEFSKSISEHLLPRMNAYHEIWLDKETDSSKQLLIGGVLQDYEPLYGPYYLPRKFKIAIAVPPRNDTDCFAHDIGLIAIADPVTKRLAGFNLAVGGGMGVTHSMKATYPRLGSVIGFVTPEQTLDACRIVMLIQRDTGNRANRKQARLKYTIDKHWGSADNFKAEVERRLGYKLAEARSYKFEANTDLYGWTQDYKGNYHCTLWLENGRVKDEPGAPFRTGLRELCKIHKGAFRLTPNQHIIVSDIKPEDKDAIDAHLRKYKMNNWEHSGVKLSASACVAFPTCGLAMAESERYLPLLMDKVEQIFEANGLRSTDTVFRMSGCANGCSRPWMAEAGFVGKAPGQYVMTLGGSHNGTRLSKIYRESVDEKEILEIMNKLVPQYAQNRLEGEAFGDYVVRAGIIKPTTEGKFFYEDMCPSDVVPPSAAAKKGAAQATEHYDRASSS
ncbi:probable sulfite reductase cys-4 [Sporisorium reilianum f. sp. reilianum]|uniref:Sulfite reductase [NADPH] subunit beta n=1 Tax=Sporisorium reilianum f. sp. reilianum TaxID=72559 RepID=A0A2N8UEC1_9BASI|nr:probable sulfite reductase cys-4 [Sporisorium reilianum f. sp. reilianum]